MTAPTVETRTPGRNVEGKYLTFILAGEEYGFEILAVHEIIGMLPVTPVPHSHPAVRGVVNLRGRVIPILDLRKRFSMPPGDVPETCIVVLRAGPQLLGVAVDAVTDVRMVRADEIEPPPLFGQEVDVSCLLGIAKSDGRVRILLDAARVLSMEPLASVPVPADIA
ncbi:MAG: chemotaxis protein CheW [Gemmatimonadales bacterium]|nr:purine-binding chemotaxis protein CheW [Gemmatimonadota bacterium]MCL4214702.1 chemotaxis protein CheW [Gemmatimonadales bacterium]